MTTERPKGLDSPLTKVIIKWMSRGQTALYKVSKAGLPAAFSKAHRWRW
jgi:hypothetical protein